MPISDLLHCIPAHAMMPEAMHFHVNRDLHADCTTETCELLRYCTEHLTERGHGTGAAADCPICSL